MLGMIISLFYGLIGLAILFIIIQYAVSTGVDSSKEVKALRSELTEIKKQLKDTKEITVIKELLPKQNKYEHANVEDVQIINDKLKVVLTVFHMINQNQKEIEDAEIRVYTFDIATQALIGDDMIATIDREREHAKTWTEVSILNDTENIEPQNQLLLKKRTLENIPYNEGFTHKEVGHTFTLYNYETNEKKDVLLNEKSQELVNYETTSFYESTIYFQRMTEKGLEILPYHIESEKFATKQTIPITTSGEKNFPIIKLKNHKMYIVSRQIDVNSNTDILITDLKTWKTLYEGTFEQTKPGKNHEEYSLHLHSLEVE